MIPLIADEATTALDVVVQRQILTRLLKLKQDLSLSLVFITHDISLVANIAEIINVMYAGKIVERASAKQLFGNPLHPYTEALLNSIPTLEKGTAIKGIKGTPPDLSKEIKGCPFADRCPIGVTVGVIAGYFGGKTDDVLMRAVDYFRYVCDQGNIVCYKD